MNTLELLPFYDLDDREFIFVNSISFIKSHEVMESDFYNLLPNPDKNDEADPDLMFINPQSDYYSISKMNILTNRQGKGISLFHCNIRSLTKNLDLLNDMLYSLDSGLDVIAISETRLNPNSISNTGLLSCNLFHVDSPTLAGGVAIYANKALKTIPRSDLKIDLPLVESCWIEIDPCNNKRHILIGCIYRHPSAGMDEFTVKLEELLKESNLNKYDAYIMGDMNIDLLKHHTHQQTGQYVDMLYSYDLLPVITKPTRITSHTATLTDHIYTNTINGLVSGIATVDIPDHLPVFCVAGTSLKKRCRKLFFRDYGNFNSDLYLHDIYAIDWNAITGQCKDLHEATTCTIGALKSIVDKQAPIKQVSRNKERLFKKPWISRGILKSIKTKHIMYKTHFLSRNHAKVTEFKKYSNRLNYLKNMSKKAYFCKHFDLCKGNLKAYWYTNKKKG